MQTYKHAIRKDTFAWGLSREFMWYVIDLKVHIFLCIYLDNYLIILPEITLVHFSINYMLLSKPPTCAPNSNKTNSSVFEIYSF